jgi:tRNA (guanine-N7-)-methyltransferase
MTRAREVRKSTACHRPCIFTTNDMGRRALPGIDPTLDLSRHLLYWEDLPSEWNVKQLFHRDAPLEVEVGSGKGMFLQSAAAGTPEHNFLGTEISRKYAAFCASRLARQSLPNAVMVRCDAQRLFTEHLTDASIAAVHVYFPDPWWKKRHHKRRIMNETFIQHIARTLSPGGSLHFWTDVKDYFDSSLELIAQHTQLVGPLSVPERAAEHDLDFRTHFERRMRLFNEPVYRSQFYRGQE